MSTAYMFDLDDTLLDPTTFSIPEKTIQALTKLKQQKHPMAIISFNRSANRIVEYFGLEAYFDCIVCDLGDRYQLYEQALVELCANHDLNKICYYDDMKNNLREVEDFHINSKYQLRIKLETFYVCDVYELFKLI